MTRRDTGPMKPEERYLERAKDIALQCEGLGQEPGTVPNRDPGDPVICVRCVARALQEVAREAAAEQRERDAKVAEFAVYHYSGDAIGWAKHIAAAIRKGETP